MKKILVGLFILFAFLALVFSFISSIAVVSLVFVAFDAIIGVIYVVFALKAEPEQKELVTDEEKENIREVKLLKSVELNKGVESEIKESYPLIHVDNSFDDEMVIRVFKKKVAIPDSSVEINK